ncbi:hypothetical protein [Spiroplasma endosymbiont of Aspidapion aeneum]|uniref:hypothetical protein n=1 Tax=Spiroplasma endosymbiont of Aspidapion aeneum TaxID=3066276 RepID=UPI00313F3D52
MFKEVKNKVKQKWPSRIKNSINAILIIGCLDIFLSFSLSLVGIYNPFSLSSIYLLIFNFSLIIAGISYAAYFLSELIYNYNLIIRNAISRTQKINKLLVINEISSFLKIYFFITFIFYFLIFRDAFTFINHKLLYNAYIVFIVLSTIVFTMSLIILILLIAYNNKLRKKLIKRKEYSLLSILENNDLTLFKFLENKISFIYKYKTIENNKNNKQLPSYFIEMDGLFKCIKNTKIITIQKGNIYPSYL